MCSELGWSMCAIQSLAVHRYPHMLSAGNFMWLLGRKKNFLKNAFLHFVASCFDRTYHAWEICQIECNKTGNSVRDKKSDEGKDKTLDQWQEIKNLSRIKYFINGMDGEDTKLNGKQRTCWAFKKFLALKYKVLWSAVKHPPHHLCQVSTQYMIHCRGYGQ